MSSSQQFDLFGVPDPEIVTATRATPRQAMLFAGNLFDHVDPDRPRPAPALDPALHTDQLPMERPAPAETAEAS